MGVVVLVGRCKGCGLCVTLCPYKALGHDEDPNELGYFPAKLVYPEKCTDCLVCEHICPDLAIFVWKGGGKK